MATIASTVRVAVVQAAPVLFDSRRSLDKLADLAADAARQGAQLAVFPEAFVGGYPKGHDFGVSVGIRTPEGRDVFRRLCEMRLVVPGEETERLAKVARDHGVALVVGVHEKDGGTLYCTALIFGSDGNLLGKHRKLMPTAMERALWGCGDGSTLPVAATALGKIGAVICWENYMPLLRAAMYARGIELYCAITVDDRDTWLPTMRHIALEGRCFVLSACQGPRTWRPSCRLPDRLVGAGATIAYPWWQLHCRAARPRPRRARIWGGMHPHRRPRPGRPSARKFDFDVVGHYARPDVFRLEVNEKPLTAVTFRGGGSSVPPQ